MNQSEISADLYTTILEWDNESGCQVIPTKPGSRSPLDDGGGPPSILIVACESSEEYSRRVKPKKSIRIRRPLELSHW